MNEIFYAWISIAGYMAFMLYIGYYSFKKSDQDIDGFLIGGRKMGPLVIALSAGAADMSGWLLMGLPGSTYSTGIAATWIVVGLVAGAYINYLIVAPRLRIYTEKANNSITLPDYFENRFKDKTRLLRFFSAFFIMTFFTLYTYSGMVAGGRLFEDFFQMDYFTGALLTSSVVVLYTLFGGFLAVSLTDVVQGLIMVTALVLIPIVAMFEVGGASEVLSTIEMLDANKLSMIEGITTVGIFSLLAWGLGYFGQPHILVRFMAIDDVRKLKKARRVGISWMIFSVLGAVLIGLIGISHVYKTGFDLLNPETIFVYFSKVLFHPLITGLLLSAILAAVMSTISSQLLVTSSSLTQDFYCGFIRKNASKAEGLLVSRISVLLVAVLAMVLAFNPTDTILNLVGNAWAGFGAAFGSVIVLSLFWKRMNWQGALAGMLVGGITVLVWVFYIKAPENKEQFGILADTYEIIPGFILATLSIVIVTLVTPAPSKEIEDSFASMEADIKEFYN